MKYIRKVRRQGGFSLLETIAAIAIICIITAILMPVFRAAKHSAQITASLSNLHQMHTALMLYQTSYGANGSYGSEATMGLPYIDQIWNTKLGVPAEVWKSPCGQNPSWDAVPNSIQYIYFPGYLERFEEIAPIYQENLLMFADLNCAEHGEPLHSEFIPHRGLGVLLSGSVVNRFRSGEIFYQRWWSDAITKKNQ